MDDYNDYVTAINKIYDYISKVKAGWNNPDNYANIDKLDEFKSLVAGCADEFKKPAAKVEEEPPVSAPPPPPRKEDELYFPQPEVEKDTIPQHAVDNDYEHESVEEPVELKSEVPRVNIKTDYTLPSINLRDDIIHPNSTGSGSQQLTRLDTSNIPSLDDDIEEELDDTSDEETEEL